MLRKLLPESSGKIAQFQVGDSTVDLTIILTVLILKSLAKAKHLSK